MEYTQLTVALIGVGSGVIIALLILLCIYCIRLRLMSRGIVNTTTGSHISRDETNMYLGQVHKIRRKRYSRQKKLIKELSALPKKKNPLVYNVREVELTMPGPAVKSEPSVVAPVDTST